MATLTQAQPVAGSASWQWVRNFAAQELAPYPGRGWTVARMTIAATLMMICIMVFRLPGAALGAYYTLLFSRESPQATVSSAITAVGAVGCSLVFILFGVVALLGNPLLHFFWVVGTMFVTFFLISALYEYRAATAFGFLAMTSIPVWDFPANTELQVQATLWTALAVVAAALITVVVELVAQRVHPFDQFSESLDVRVKTVENTLRSWAYDQLLDNLTRQKLVQFAMTGIATLRRLLLRSRRTPQDAAEWSALVALIGRLIDLSANREERQEALSLEEKDCCRKASAQLQFLRSALARHDLPAIAKMDASPSQTPGSSFLAEVENTIAQIPQVFAGLQPLSEYLPSAMDLQKPNPLFREDAFSNADHLRFALKGTLAACSCYVIYNAVAWRGLSTAVATCMITALSTIGSSRQKQLLRVAGAILGGVVIGMSVQAFLLPHIDSITEFTVLFAGVTACASWLATASPRLSYAGVQMAFAFYVTHLRTFGPQTSLAIARDDVLGILLGLGAMWISFDRIWAKDAAFEVVDSFVANLRRIAKFHSSTAEGDRPIAINRSRAERAAINANFDRIRNEADALLFEFGKRWRQKVALRNRVRAWQPLLRTYFLLEISLVHYRLQAAGRRLAPEAETNVAESEALLEQLANLEDWRRKDQVEHARISIRQILNRVDELLTPAGATLEKSDSSPVAISRSMLQVTRDLARAMVEAH